MNRDLSRFVIFFAAVSLVCAGIFSFSPQRAYADSPIKIISTSTVSKFRQSFTFYAKASSSAGTIIAAHLIFHVLGSVPREEQDVTPKKFTPASEVNLEYDWNTRNITTPPWQIVFYAWELFDDAGNRFRSEPIKTEFTDDTRNWQTLSDGKVSVYWYDKILAYGKGLLKVTEQGFAHVSKATGYSPDQELRVVVYNSQADFCSFWAKGECLDWYGGVSISAITVQWARDNAYEQSYLLRQVIPHELSHAFLNYWVGSYVVEIPDWFNEGQAVNNQIDGIDELLSRAHSVVRAGRWIRFAKLGVVQNVQNDPGDPNAERVRDWYAQATSMVNFLYQKYGLEIMGKIVSKVKGAKRFQDAFTEATGMRMDQYEAAWLKWMGVTKLPPTFTPTPVDVPTPAYLPLPPAPTYEPTASS